MKRKTFTIQDLRKRKEAAEHVEGSARNLHQRRKVNCLCRSTPSGGIIAMHPDYARALYDDQMRFLLTCCNPGHIADRAIQIGNVLAKCGRPLLALKLMQTSLKHLIYVDDNLQEDYALNHFYPGVQFAQWYQYWPERVSEVDARRLGSHIDELANEVYQRLGYDERSRLRFRVRDRYECMFHWIYEC